MTKLRPQTLYDASAAGNGDWKNLDYSYPCGAVERTLLVYRASALDTITIQAVTIKDPADASATTDIVTVDTVLGGSAGVTLVTFTEPYSFIRAVKTNANGAAKVQGLI